MPRCAGPSELELGVIDFGRLSRRQVEGRFDGGSMTSDGGVMLLAASDCKVVVTLAAARCKAVPLKPLRITHAVGDMLRQRVESFWGGLGGSERPQGAAVGCGYANPPG
jgi:hypothetical protein